MEKRTAAMVVAALILAVTGCRETVTIGEDSQSPGGDVSLPRGDGASWEEVRLLPDLPRGEVASTVDVDGNADDAPYPPDVTEVTADLAGEVWTVEKQPALCDFDGDGASDLALFYPSDGTWHVRTLEGTVLVDGVPFGFSGVIPVPGDYDGDGKWDMAVFHPDSGNWYAMAAGGEDPILWDFKFGYAGVVPLALDLDGDGVVDPTVYDPHTSLWYATTIDEQTLLWEELVGGPGMTPVAGDFDGDGASDPALYDPAKTSWHVRLPDEDVTAGGAFDGTVAVPVPGDYDGDGASDLAAWDRVSAEWYANGLGGEGITAKLQWGWAGGIPVGGDYDGDGSADFAVHDRANNRWYIRNLEGDTLAWEEPFGFPGAVPVCGVGAQGGPRVAHIFAEETAGPEGQKSSIATDSIDQPHIVVEAGVGGPHWNFMDKVDGEWLAPVPLNIKDYSPSSNSFSGVHIEVDGRDRAWASGFMVTANDWTSVGMGIIIRTDIAEAPSQFHFSKNQLHPSSWDTGYISLDPALPDECICYTSDGYWKRYGWDDGAVGKVKETEFGQMYTGKGGEKNSFYISKAGKVSHPGGTSHGVWHAAIVGCSNPQYYQHSYYQNSMRHAKGESPVVWAHADAYDLGDDHNYPGIIADARDPLVAYVAQDVYDVGLVLNIWDGEKMVFDPSSLMLVDAQAVVTARFSPHFASAAGGGAYIVWSRNGTLMLRWVAPNGEMGEDVEIGPGWKPNLVADGQGALHLVYMNNGTRYRKVLTY